MFSFLEQPDIMQFIKSSLLVPRKGQTVVQRSPHMRLLWRTLITILKYFWYPCFFLHIPVNSLCLTSQLIWLHGFLSPGDHTPRILVSFWKLIPTLFFPRTGGNLGCQQHWCLTSVCNKQMFAFCFASPHCSSLPGFGYIQLPTLWLLTDKEKGAEKIKIIPNLFYSYDHWRWQGHRKPGEAVGMDTQHPVRSMK